jgi:hypothetical protein
MKWIREHTIAALTLIGLLFYGGALLAYSRFYGAFGVEPEEAGVSYATALARVSPAFVSWLTILFGLAVLGSFVFLLLSSLYKWIRKMIQWVRKTIGRSEQADKRSAEITFADLLKFGVFVWLVEGGWKPTLKWGVASVFALTTIAFLALAFFTSADLATRVKAGESIRPADLFKGSGLSVFRNPLRIRVEHVRLVRERPPQRLRSGMFAYLGRSGDTVILYDPKQAETLRVPAANLILSNPER